jgi:sugar lactone lactonase YvrE
VVILSIAVAAGLSFTPARARGDEAAAEESLAPTAAQTKALLESGKAGALVEAPETDLHAALTMPHRDLDRGEALELAEAVFEPELEGVGGIYDQFEPERFLSNYAAVVPVASLPEGPGQTEEGLAAEHPNTPVLVESMLPLRTEGAAGEEEAVNLELEHSEGELQPQNPLAQVGIPDQLGEGISLSASEIELTIAGAPDERTATDAGGEFAFYPEVAQDSDLIVAPTPRGVETMTDLRSTQAPMQTTYDLGLPAGAELRATKEGGAEVVEGGRPTLLIPAPTATDAAGNPVETELIVSRESITVAVTPNPSTPLPILVDPTFIEEGWRWTLNHDSMAAWSPSTTNAAAMDPWPYERWNPTWYPGLDLTSGVGGVAYWGNNTNWEYQVPRYREDLTRYGEPPTSWVYRMFTEGVLFLPYGNTENYPALVIGLVDPNHGWEVSGVHYGGQGEMDNWGNQFTFTNEYEQTGDKGADMNLVTYSEEQPAKLRDTYMADAYISVVDTDAPRILELNPPEKWVGGSWASVPYMFEDPGLGMELIRIGLPGEAPLRWAEGFGCNGTTASVCPRVTKSSEAGRPALAFVPNELPTGKDKLEVTASDVLGSVGVAGHTTQGYVVVKVDHTAPEITLSGSLTEQGSIGTHRPAYALRVNAKDGAAGAPQSGVKKVEVLVDGKAVALPEPAEWEPNCQSENCSLNGEWTMNASEYGAGPHEVKVVATDAVGNVSTKAIQVELHPPAPTLSVSGTMTEQATLGTERPSYKLHVNSSALAESPTPAATPTYSASFGSSGTGNGQFSRPGSMAIDAQGSLWVVDSNGNRVEKFNEKGEYLSQFGTKGSANGQLSRPTAIAIAANGNLWVTDSGNRRVEEFTPAGAYVAKFGSAGTGQGQFAGSGPEAIAIDYHGNIWVTDTYGGRLEKFNENGAFVRSVATKGSGPGQLGQPDGIAIGPGGNVFASDWEDDKVAEYGEGGAFIRQFGSQGSEPGQLQDPTGIAIDGRGDIWVPDEKNGRVEEFNQGGEYLGRFGAKGTGAGQFELSYPTGIATDAKGDIWVTDAGDNRVEKWVSAGYVPAGATFLRSFGTEGTANGQFRWPIGVATDGKGNVWVSDFFNNRIEKFNESGGYLSQFGSAGAGNGQFVYPYGVAVDPKGHVWVADDENNRIQEFSESDSFIRAFGTLGVGSGQLHSPLGIAVDSKNDVWVTDALNYRVEEFSETGAYIRSFGIKGSGPGQFSAELRGLAVTPGGNVWVADSGANRIDEFTETGGFVRQVGGEGSGSASFQAPNDIDIDANGNLWVTSYGSGRVVELSPQGESISQFGSPGSGTGQFQHPVSIALDGKGHAFVTDYTANKVDEWSLPQAHSQVSTEITVDGKRVEATEASCAAETCSASKEWTLQSSSLVPGPHEVVVRATDGLGNTTSKTLNIKVGDTTKPSLEVGGELVQAPEGWIEQAEGNYGLHATATDSGYGVTSLVFSLDGKAVAEKVQTCPAGVCSATISTTVNAHGLTAGEHPAEVVAKDGAGNVATKKWTVNVDPEGHITTAEALATVEAAEGTSGTALVTSQSEELEGLGVEAAGSTEYRATGTNVPLTISKDPSEGFELEVLAQGQLGPPCDEATPKQPDPGEGSGASPPDEPVFLEEAEKEEECVPMVVLEEAQRLQEEEVAEGLKRPGLAPITIEPKLVSTEASSASLVNGESTLAANTGAAVDTVTRPLADGGLSFAAIREASAPEHYAYEMNLAPELELRSVDSTHVEVVYKEENIAAFTIEAVPAHDAIGTAVPTHLEVTGADVITLTVEHRSPSPAGGQFVYPVVGGTGWQGGYRTISVELTEPPPPTEEDSETYELEQLGAGNVIVGSSTVGPPEETQALSKTEALALGLNPTTHPTKSGKKFEFAVCRPHSIPSVELLSFPRAEAARVGGEHLHFHCHDPSFGGNYWSVAVYGKFHFVEHHRVWLNWKEWNCDKITGEQRQLEFGVVRSEKPTLEHCDAFYPNGAHYPSGDRFKGPIEPLAEYRFPAGSGQWPAEARTNCLVVGGELYPNPRIENPLEEPLVYHRPYQVMPGENCRPINE